MSLSTTETRGWRPRPGPLDDWSAWLALLLVASMAMTVAVTAAPLPVSANTQQKVEYRYPVTGPIVDTYRPSGQGAGTNAGIDLAVPQGSPVGAPADGTVAFAGQVGGDLHVVVRHADGVRTSISFVAEVLVSVGAKVKAGQVVAKSAGAVHFGARIGDKYLDPRTLVEPDPGSARVRLVSSSTDMVPASQEAERLHTQLMAVGANQGRTLKNGKINQGARDALDVLLRYTAAGSAATLAGVLPSMSLLTGVAAAMRDNKVCTAAGVPVEAKPGRGRVLVTVRGLGSDNTSVKGRSPVLNDDLGYAQDDMFTFSYSGFGPERDGRPTSLPYSSKDTWTGISGPGSRLASYLRAVADARPGKPIDVIGHSLGGSVAQFALAADPGAAGKVATLTTLGSPHQGTELASLVASIALDKWGRKVNDLSRSYLDLDGANPTITDLQPLSPFQLSNRSKPVQGQVRALAIASRWDGVVPNLRSRIPGARAVTLTEPPNRGLDGLGALGLDGLSFDHRSLQEALTKATGDPTLAKGVSKAIQKVEKVPGLYGVHFDLTQDAAVRREILRNLAGQAPTCRSTPDIVGDAGASALLQYLYLRATRSVLARGGVTPMRPGPDHRE